MTWVKIDDQAMTNAKVLAAGPDAVTLWLAGLCYANAQHNDGVIPKVVLNALYPSDEWDRRRRERAARRLVEVRLWVEEGDHWRIHDYADYQEEALKVAVAERREYERQRKAAQRERRKSERLGGLSQRDTAGTALGTGAGTALHMSEGRDDASPGTDVSRPPVPSRPDPARPSPVPATQTEARAGDLGYAENPLDVPVDDAAPEPDTTPVRCSQIAADYETGFRRAFPRRALRMPNATDKRFVDAADLCNEQARLDGIGPQEVRRRVMGGFFQHPKAKELEHAPGAIAAVFHQLYQDSVRARPIASTAGGPAATELSALEAELDEARQTGADIRPLIARREKLIAEQVSRGNGAKA